MPTPNVYISELLLFLPILSLYWYINSELGEKKLEFWDINCEGEKIWIVRLGNYLFYKNFILWQKQSSIDFGLKP